MQCPKCSHNRHRALITNSLLETQTVRKRICNQCSHVWFTVEAEVSRYKIGWSTAHQNKPVLRTPVALQLDCVPELPPGRPKVTHDEMSQPG
jgi:hypothetical protein